MYIQLKTCNICTLAQTEERRGPAVKRTLTNTPMTCSLVAFSPPRSVIIGTHFVCLSVCLSVCLPVCLPACLSVCLYVCLSITFRIRAYQFIDGLLYYLLVHMLSSLRQCTMTMTRIKVTRDI